MTSAGSHEIHPVMLLVRFSSVSPDSGELERTVQGLESGGVLVAHSLSSTSQTRREILHSCCKVVELCVELGECDPLLHDLTEQCVHLYGIGDVLSVLRSDLAFQVSRTQNLRWGEYIHHALAEVLRRKR